MLAEKGECRGGLPAFLNDSVMGRRHALQDPPRTSTLDSRRRSRRAAQGLPDLASSRGDGRVSCPSRAAARASARRSAGYTDVDFAALIELQARAWLDLQPRTRRWSTARPRRSPRGARDGLRQRLRAMLPSAPSSTRCIAPSCRRGARHDASLRGAEAVAVGACLPRARRLASPAPIAATAMQQPRAIDPDALAAEMLTATGVSGAAGSMNVVDPSAASSAASDRGRQHAARPRRFFGQGEGRVAPPSATAPPTRATPRVPEFAAVMRCPRPVCENNSTASSRRWPATAGGHRRPCRVFGVPGVRVDGNDLWRPQAVASEAHAPAGAHAARGRTYRHYGH